ncbi:hypothetical protein MalM25_12390 [Planctomycetes bacterium MalM25]|nr:hypothetical protein MalM25_12390 [Planctomycetes bacterium MalM25]
MIYLRHERVDEQTRGVRLTMGGPTNAWVDATTRLQAPRVGTDGYSVYPSGVRGATESAAPDEPLVLLRERYEPGAGTFTTGWRNEPDYPLDGLMLWIEPLPDPPPLR